MLDLQEFTGRYVRLVPIRREHVQGLFEAGNKPEIWTYMFMKVRSLEDMGKIVEDALESMKAGTEFTYTIVDQQSDRIVGSTRMYDYVPKHRQLEIGSTWLTPDVWRTALNTECKYLLLKYCFETLHLLRVQLKTDGRNLRSQRAIERLGATQEGVLRKHRVLPDGYVRDTVMYSILHDEWDAVKSKLEAYISLESTGC